MLEESRPSDVMMYTDARLDGSRRTLISTESTAHRHRRCMGSGASHLEEVCIGKRFAAGVDASAAPLSRAMI